MPVAVPTVPDRRARTGYVMVVTAALLGHKAQRVFALESDPALAATAAANLKRAHAFIESGVARGKVVLEGF